MAEQVNSVSLLSSTEEPRSHKWRRLSLGRLRQDPLALAGGVIVSIFVICALFAQWIAPYPPLQQDLQASLQGPSGTYWLGADQFGRDILSRIIYGSRVSIIVGVVAVSVAVVIGGVLGLLAGMIRGTVETVIMRLMDIMLAFPTLLIALLIVAIFEPSIIVVIFAVGISAVPNVARLIRAEVLMVREREYVLAARSIGVGDVTITLRHVLPNVVSPVIVAGAALLASAILTEANLSFLGLGVPQDVASWGSMVNEGKTHLLSDPLVPTLPGLAIMIIVAAVNFLGDFLRDILDPRLKREVT